MSKPRYDGKGTEFGDMHRALPKWLGMFDIDRMKAEFSGELDLKREDVGFVEYVTDFSAAQVTFKALFEIKHHLTDYVAKAMECKVGTATFAQREMARRLGARYFYVIANNGVQPFVFHEMIDDRFVFVGTLDYQSDNRSEKINEFWHRIGLL